MLDLVTRNRRVVGFAIAAFVLACRPTPNVAQSPPAAPELWVWQYSHLNNPGGVDAVKKALDASKALGYTGMAFWDVSAVMITSPNWGDPEGIYLKQALSYAESKGMKTAVITAPFGYSNEVLVEHPDWAEAQRVVGTRFKVDGSGRTLEVVDSFTGLADAGFEDGKGTWLSKGDRGAAIDKSVFHSGTASGVIRDAPADARFTQALKVTPWRQYRIRLFAKTQNYKGDAPTITVLDAGNADKVRFSAYVDIQPTQDWVEFNAVFNSQDSTDARLYFGEWGGSTGSVWFDDVEIHETAMVHLIRRAGAPFRVYDPESGKDFEEGKDYTAVTVPKPLGEPFGSYQPPPVITLARTTSFKPGQTVAVDSYAVQPIIPPTEYGMCLTDAGVQKWLLENAKRVTATIPQSTGIFLQYDEMRHANSCASCKAKGMTAGQLVASHVSDAIKLYQSLRPPAPIYVWSDMFDPLHNAHDNYFLVEGDLAGAWNGLPSNVVVMNWNGVTPKESLSWFAGGNSKQPVAYRQIIAGTDRPEPMKVRLKAAAGIPGIIGVMYTAWGQDYSRLKAFADAVKDGWPEYQASLH
jgi:hypothetical protein